MMMDDECITICAAGGSFLIEWLIFTCCRINFRMTFLEANKGCSMIEAEMTKKRDRMPRLVKIFLVGPTVLI